MPGARITIPAGMTIRRVRAARVKGYAGIDRRRTLSLRVALGLHVANPLRSVIAGVVTRVVYGLCRPYKKGDGGKDCREGYAGKERYSFHLIPLSRNQDSLSSRYRCERRQRRIGREVASAFDPFARRVRLTEIVIPVALVEKAVRGGWGKCSFRGMGQTLSRASTFQQRNFVHRPGPRGRTPTTRRQRHRGGAAGSIPCHEP